MLCARHHFAPAIPFQHRVNITIPGFFSYLFIKSLFYFFYFHNFARESYLLEAGKQGFFFLNSEIPVISLLLWAS